MEKKSKQLRLKPTQRDNRRYFIVDSLDQKEIENAILKYIGVLGFSKAAFMFVKDEKIIGKTIGSCDRVSLINVKTALILSGIKVEKVASTIKGLKDKQK